jgi:hypothetical protein
LLQFYEELDRHFLLALKEQLFWPIKGRMRSGGKSRVGERLYRPSSADPRSDRCRTIPPRAISGPAP